jgi:hypothetical protein
VESVVHPSQDHGHKNVAIVYIFMVITLKNENKIYVQVAYKMTEQSTIDREFYPLLEIKDNHPKYVVTMDEFWKDNIEGIKHVYIADFLLMENWL